MYQSVSSSMLAMEQRPLYCDVSPNTQKQNRLWARVRATLFNSLPFQTRASCKTLRLSQLTPGLRRLADNAGKPLRSQAGATVPRRVTAPRPREPDSTQSDRAGPRSNSSRKQLPQVLQVLLAGALATVFLPARRRFSRPGPWGLGGVRVSGAGSGIGEGRQQLRKTFRRLKRAISDSRCFLSFSFFSLWERRHFVVVVATLSFLQTPFCL